jgi:hypothetical protein
MNKVLNEADDPIISAMNEHTFSGVSVAIAHGGRLVYLRCLGLPEIEQQKVCHAGNHLPYRL